VGQRQKGSRTLGGHDCGLLGADQGGDEVVKRGTGADFVIRMSSRRTDFSVGEQLPGETFAQNEQLDGLTSRQPTRVRNFCLLLPRIISAAPMWLKCEAISSRPKTGQPWEI